MIGKRGACLCERTEEMRAFRARVDEQVTLGAFAMKGHELDKLARTAIAFDTFVREQEADAVNPDDTADRDYQRLSVAELDALAELLERAPTKKTHDDAHRGACGHVDLLERVRALVQEQVTSPGFPLAAYELANLSQKAMALDALIASYEEERQTDTLDFGALSPEDFATYVALVEKARRL